jgi:hypothetical protein
MPARFGGGMIEFETSLLAGAGAAATRPSLRIPLLLTLIVVVTGIIAIIVTTVRGDAIRVPYVVAWIVVSLVLIGITAWVYFGHVVF